MRIVYLIAKVDICRKHYYMKKNIIFLFASVVILFTVQSCGTISSSISDWPKGMRPVYLHNCPNDAVVKCNGINIPIEESEYVRWKDVTKIKMPTIFLPYKLDTSITISSASLGKSETISLKSKLWGFSTTINCCTFPIMSHIIDYATKNDRVLKPRVIDVTAFLNGKSKSEWTTP